MEVPLSKNNKEILIIRLLAMGDVAMLIPIVERLKIDNPKTGITILTNKIVVPLFAHIDDIDVIGWDFKKDGSFMSIFSKFREVSRLKKFDVVIDLHDVIRTKVFRRLFYLLCTKVVKIDKGRDEKKALTEQHSCKQLKTTVQRYIDAIKAGGMKIDIPNPTLVKHNMPIPKSIIEIVGEKKGTWIGVAPFAKHQGKAYPLHLMKQVMDILATNDNISFFIFSGGGDERKLANELAGNYRNAVSVFGKIKLDGELKLIANIDCMITMDSGAMHFASAVGTPVVSIWGATHPWAGFLGYGQSSDNVIQCDMDCRPCSVFGNKPCFKVGNESYECMKKISPDKVVERVLKVIETL